MRASVCFLGARDNTGKPLVYSHQRRTFSVFKSLHGGVRSAATKEMGRGGDAAALGSRTRERPGEEVIR